MSEQENGFDWSTLGAEWWAESGATCGATDLQVRFAVGKHRGLTSARAAREAGYSGDSETIRQAGSRAAKSTTVMNLLALAKAENGAGDDGTVGTAEAKRILSRLARGSDPNVRIKAIESLNKIEAAERAANRSEEAGNPTETARAIICAVPSLHGAALAVGMWFAEYKQIDTFPFLREVAPLLANKIPEEWQQWRGAGLNQYLDSIASGPLLSPDEIVALLSRTVTRSRPPLPETTGQEETTDAAA